MARAVNSKRIRFVWGAIWPNSGQNDGHSAVSGSFWPDIGQNGVHTKRKDMELAASRTLRDATFRVTFFVPRSARSLGSPT